MVDERELEKMANRLKTRLIGGTLFGLPIDGTDDNLLLLAAHYLGRKDEEADRIQQADLYMKSILDGAR